MSDHSLDSVLEDVEYVNPLVPIKAWEPGEAVYDSLPVSQWHYHPEVEFSLIQSGRIAIETTEEYFDLLPGDIAIIGASQTHRTISKAVKGNSALVVQLHLQPFLSQSTMSYMAALAESLHSLSALNKALLSKEGLKQQVRDMLLLIYGEVQECRPGYELGVTSCVQRILCLLVRADSQQRFVQSNDLNKLAPVFDYVERHLAEEIQATEACKLLPYNYHYFLRLFKEITGMTFTQYVHRRKIRQAENLILAKTENIEEVALRVGFSSTSHFFKLFKRFNGCSPGEFRKRKGVSP